MTKKLFVDCGLDVSKYDKLWRICTVFSSHTQSLKQTEDVKGYLLMVDYGGDIGIITESYGTLSSHKGGDTMK